jgi:hypothetical protein
LGDGSGVERRVNVIGQRRWRNGKLALGPIAIWYRIVRLCRLAFNIADFLRHQSDFDLEGEAGWLLSYIRLPSLYSVCSRV